MADMKSLAKDTAIYGVSSMLGKFLNWCLLPFYTYVFHSTSEYGVSTDLYNWTAVLLVLLTYGMETGYFRFVNKSSEPSTVYSTSLFSLGTTSALFILICTLFYHPIASFVGYSAHPEFVWMMFTIVAIDAFCAIPFAYLRYQKRPVAFATLKMVMIFSNIFFNIFFLWISPKIYASRPELVSWYFNPAYGVGYAFVANFCSSVIGLLMLIPFMRFRWKFNGKLLKEMLKYSAPLLVLGLAGIMNQSFDKIIYKYLFDDQNEALRQLGIYGACFRISMVMMMFTQAFRYAYEPFVFAKQQSQDSRKAYSDATKYYIIVSVLIFLGVMYYIDILQYLISPDYRVGLVIVPIVLGCYIFQGVYFNLSFWYKLTDKNNWGAIIALIGAVLTIGGNILLVPQFGYVGSAWVSFGVFFLMMLISYFLGQKYYPIQYDLKSAGRYTLIAIVLYVAGMYVPIDSMVLRIAYRTVLFALLLAYIVKKDVPEVKTMFSKLRR